MGALQDVQFLAKRFKGILDLAQDVEDETALKAQVNDLTKVVESLRNQVTAKQAEIHDLSETAKREYQDSQDQIDASKKKLAAYIKKAESDAADLRARTSEEVTIMTEKGKDQLRALDKQIAEKNQELESVKADIDKHSKFRDKVKADINKIKEIL